MTEKGARVAEESQRIVDGVHREVLASLSGGDREGLLRMLRTLAEGELAEPVESPRPARRARWTCGRRKAT